MLEFAQWLEATPVSVAIKSAAWVVPLLQSIHIVTLATVFSSILMVAMRAAGAARMDQSIREVVERFSPWVAGGLVVLLLTGVGLTLGEPVRQLMSLSFRVKMALVATAAFLAWRFKLRHAGTGHSPARDTSPAGAAAWATVAMWLLIIFLGRAIAYDLEVWGAWSPSPRNTAANK